MRRTSRRTNTMASLVLAIVFSGPATAQVDAGNEPLMNLVLQMQQLQDEIRMLRGQIEEQAYELESLKRRQRDQYLDLDQRISELRDGLPTVSGQPSAAARPATRAPNPATPPSGDEPAFGPASSTSAPAVDVPDVDERGGPPSSVTGLAAPAVATSTMAATPEEQQAAYDEAFQALRELRYADAAESFRSFLDRYPNSDLAGNAQYWLGESYYVTRNYEIALQAFQELVGQYPDSTKRGDGLLKIGFTHYELEQYGQARSALEQVKQEFPDSTLARLADSRLRAMRAEGRL